MDPTWGRSQAQAVVNGIPAYRNRSALYIQRTVAGCALHDRTSTGTIVVVDVKRPDIKNDRRRLHAGGGWWVWVVGAELFLRVD